MNVEQMITEELRTVGAAVLPPPPPDAALLIGEARRDRIRSLTRRVGSGILAAAVVLSVVLLGSHLGNPSATPPPTPQPTSLPTGAAPTIPYVRAGTLYLDGQGTSTGWDSVSYEGAGAIGTRAGGDSLVTPIYLFYGGRPVRAITNASTQGAVLSPDGKQAAWVERVRSGADGGRWEVVAYDLAKDRELGRTSVDAHLLGHVGEENEGWLHLTRIDDNGAVWWAGLTEYYKWKPRSTPVQIDPNAYTGDKLTGFPADAGDVAVSPDRVWGAWLTDQHGRIDPGTVETWRNDGVTLQKPESSRSRFTLKLPVGTDARGLDWESDSAVLVTVFDDPDGTRWHYLRCHLATRRCEVAPTAR